jgi:hypothetical protein
MLLTLYVWFVVLVTTFIGWRIARGKEDILDNNLKQLYNDNYPINTIYIGCVLIEWFEFIAVCWFTCMLVNYFFDTHIHALQAVCAFLIWSALHQFKRVNRLARMARRETKTKNLFDSVWKENV